MQFRRHRTWLAVIAVLCALVASGCKRKTRNRIITLEETRTTDFFNSDSFPGSSVQTHNVADDRRAFSVPDESPDMLTLKVTFNGDRGSAIVTYTTLAASTGLYAHYYDGDVFTPPVALRAIDTTYVSLAPRQVVHAFLNTKNHDDDDARDRNGDALIAWAAEDVDQDGAPTADGVNRALFVTYFDESDADEIDRRFGFQEFATRVDAQDEAGENVGTFGIATDGLCGAARWGAVSAYQYGDETTAIELFWTQNENNDGVPGIDDIALYSVRFDPGEDLDDDLPLTPQRLTRLSIATLGASDAGTSSEETFLDSALQSYNNVLLFRMAANNLTGADDLPGGGIWGTPFLTNGTDVVFQTIAFDLETGSISPASVIHPVVPSATDAIENAAEPIALVSVTGPPPGLYGSDEGLATMVFVFLTLTNDPDLEVDFGDLANDGRVTLAEISEADGSLLGIALLDVEDPDISDSPDPGAISVVLSRNGDYLWAAWLETLDSGGTDEAMLWAAQYQTTRIGEDDVFPLPPALAGTVSAPFPLLTDVDGSPVVWFCFQDCLGYICGVQSNPDVMNVFAMRVEGAADVIHQVRLVADVDMDPPGCTPAVTASVLETFSLGDQPGAGPLNTPRHNFNAVDNGDDGHVLAVYRRDIDPVGTDFRLFAENGGTEAPGVLEIDSVVTYRQVPLQPLTLVCVPPGSSIGEYDSVDDSDDGERAHGARWIHILFLEDSSTEDSPNGDQLRTRAFFAEEDDLIFADRFTPSASPAEFEAPFDLGLPNLDTFGPDQPTVVGIEVEGDVVGVWFTQSEHVYFTAHDGESNDGETGWYNTDGISDPALVDDDTTFELPEVPRFFAPSCTCEGLDRAMVFWTKETDGFSGRRMFVRVLDSDID
ncbi:MAG: hypothetical protein HUU15_11280 [Candidatus Brocadiae bacterium]|nr:hypothetical protein [Candidatus Brocadiia bacterium]